MTKHQIIIGDARRMELVNDNSVDLVITSPPYPMIGMWDDIMSSQNPEIAGYLQTEPDKAFELMHRQLDEVWEECFRVIKPGGFLCINIGDATRTISGRFQLFVNHARVQNACSEIGFTSFPGIIWRKQTNAPNKFMGSGMLPCGAYVTLEHEHILVFRKGDKRPYNNKEEKDTRKESAFFWEERNVWFSDVWDIKGVKQSIGSGINRERSAAYPLEIPHRLINMFSQKGDVVLDPFVGLGTTTKAAMLNQRNSIGYDIDPDFRQVISDTIGSIDVKDFNDMIDNRLEQHKKFILEREEHGKEVKHFNHNLDCKVITAQEENMNFSHIKEIRQIENKDLIYEVEHD